MSRNIDSAAKQQERDHFREVVGKQPKGVWLILSTLGLLMIVAGTIIPIFNGRTTAYADQNHWFAYVYGAGALLQLVTKFLTPYTGNVIRVKRLYRIEMWSAVCFCVATFFVFYNPETTRDWLAFTLAGGALLIYTSIMIPRTINKALKNKNK